MAYEVLKGKSFSWYHFSQIDGADIDFMKETFKFHPLDYDDLTEDAALSKLDVYKHYLFAIFTVPIFDRLRMHVSSRNIAVFISKDFVVTVTQTPLDSADRFFARANRSVRLRRNVLGKSTGFFLYAFLDYIFRDAKAILKELVREVNTVEASVYDSRTRVTTRRLGTVRRNVLFMRHVIDPQRILINQLLNTKLAFFSKDLQVYYDDVRDTLDSIWVVSDNLKNIVDGLFDVNEALLSHRTNEIIRILTVISVILMPPTLITGYYGMNIDRLPFAGDIGIVTAIIASSIVLFLIYIFTIDRRNK